MGIFSAFKNLKQRIDEMENFHQFADYFRSLSRSRGSVPTRNKAAILQVFHKNPWLSLAVDTIAKNIASIEMYIEETYPSGDVIEKTNHPLLGLLANPNPLLLGYTQMYIISAMLDLVGECLMLLERDPSGNIIAMYPISSEHIVQMPYKNNPYWRLRAGKEVISVYVTEVMYIKIPDMVNFYGRGQGKAQALNDEISIHELSGKQISQYFANNATPEYLIALEGAGKDQATRLRDNWLNRNQGWVKRYLPHFVSGKMTVQKLQSEFKDMELNNLRKDQKDNIMQYYQIPEELYGKSSNSNRATSYIAETNFAKQVLVPRLDLITMFFNHYIMTEYSGSKNIRIELKYRNPVPRDKEHEMNYMQRFQYAFSINEIRAGANKRNVEGLDDVYPVPIGIRLTPFDSLTVQEQDAIKGYKKAFTKASESELKTLAAMIDLVDFDDTLNLDKYTKSILKEYLKLTDKTGSAVYSDLGASIDFDITNEDITEAISKLAGDRLSLMNETLKKDLRNQLMIGYAEGDSIPDIMERLKDSVFKGRTDLTASQLERIARTETMTTVNYGTLVSYESLGVEGKEWIATMDDRTRETHLLLDGQTAPVGEEFETVYGDKAIAPGQFGIAEEDINCRCTIGAKTLTKSKGAQKFRDEQDKRASGAESAYKKAYSNYFKAIEKGILKELKKL